MVFHFTPDGSRITHQEEDRNCNGKPDRLTRFDEEGLPTFRCTPYELIEFAAGNPTQAIEDSTRDGYGDRRQVFRQAVQIRLDADTNADRKPDIWIEYGPDGTAKMQLEDSDFDGRVDAKFDLTTDEAVETNGGEPPSLDEFGRVSCREFSDFWKN